MEHIYIINDILVYEEYLVWKDFKHLLRYTEIQKSCFEKVRALGLNLYTPCLVTEFIIFIIT